MERDDQVDECMTYRQTEIPRHPKWGGPFVIPPDKTISPGPHKCKSCGRELSVKRCPHVYYKRCTTWIDVLQSEFALKAYDRRMVAYGMSQRDDLNVAVAALRDIDGKDKDTLQKHADAAKEHAKAAAGANIGTALHRFTEDMDNGLTLGRVPEPYPADLKAYEEATKGIEWVAIESFRVHDEYKVAGTCDRLGWINGHLAICDLKTSPKENPISYPHGPAMQLAMYARSIPYDIPTDMRVSDPAQINLNTAYIISLPAGKGRCEIRPIDIWKGWGACTLAAKVWNWRNTKDLILDDDKVQGASFMDMAARAGSIQECRRLWRNAEDICALTPALDDLLRRRAKELKESA